MSIAEKTRDCQVTHIPLGEVYSDTEFNCRGVIAPIDVIDLAKNIQKQGLLQPIVVQPYSKIPDKKYRIIVGHRRFEAFNYLNRETIPAIVVDHLSDDEAAVWNLVENIERRDLNMLQESKAIQKYKDAGWTMKKVANLLGVSTGWVQTRFAVLNLPEDIQKEVAAGLFNTEQIKEISGMGEDDQYAAVRTLKDAKAKGQKRIKLNKNKKKNPNSKKQRTQSEMRQMLDMIYNGVGPCLATRVLAWATAEIRDIDLLEDISREAKEQGKPWSIPEEYL